MTSGSPRSPGFRGAAMASKKVARATVVGHDRVGFGPTPAGAPIAGARPRWLELLLQIKPVQVHHLVPRRHEGTGELLLRIRASIHLRESPQLRVGSEYEIGPRGCPLELATRAITPFVHFLCFRG